MNKLTYEELEKAYHEAVKENKEIKNQINMIRDVLRKFLLEVKEEIKIVREVL